MVTHCRGWTPSPVIDHYPEGISWDFPINYNTPVHEQVLAVCERTPRADALDFLGAKTTFGDLGRGHHRTGRSPAAAIWHRQGQPRRPAAPQHPRSTSCAYYAVLRTRRQPCSNCNPLYTVQRTGPHHLGFRCRDQRHARPRAAFEKAEKLVQEGAAKTVIACHFPDALPFPKKLLYRLFKSKDLARIAASPIAAQVVHYRDLIARNDYTDARAIDRHEDIAVQQYTGGTTGEPKGPCCPTPTSPPT